MTAEDRITAYLFANKSKIEFSTLDLVVEEVKLRLFYGMSPISDDEIRKIVSRWALINAVGLLTKPTSAGTAPAKSGTPPPASDSELIDTVKKAISTLNAGVTIGKKGGNINIGVTGLTANLQKGADSSSLGVSWGGTLKAEAVSGPFHFAASLSKESWSITLSFPQDTYLPDLSTLRKGFAEGERAIWKMAEATRTFNKISDAPKVGALIKPHVAALQEAVEAARGIAEANKQGGPSFGFTLGSLQPGPGEPGRLSGIEGSIVFTYVF